MRSPVFEDFLQRVMKAAGADAPSLCCCGHKEHAHLDSGGICLEHPCECKGFRFWDRVEFYPDPLTPAGSFALWDALVHNGFFVRVCSPIHGGIHIARVYRDGSPEERGPGAQHEDRAMALVKAAANALGLADGWEFD